MKLKHLFVASLALMGGVNAWAADEITSGTNYYIQNVESGLFLCGANSWGTQGSVTTQGEMFYVTLNNGTYTLTNTNVSASNKTFGYNLYVDANTSQNGNAWTVAPVDGEQGVFTLHGKGKANNTPDSFDAYLCQSATAGTHIGYLAGSVATADNTAKWRFITREEAIAQLKTVTWGKSMPASFLLENPNFSRNHATTKWTVSSDCTNKNLSGGTDNNKCAESYHSPFTISQKLEGIPNGVYGVTAQGFVRSDGGNVADAVFFANEATKAMPEKTGAENSMIDASNSFSTGAYTIEEFKVTVTDGTLEVGVKNTANNLWCIWDNFNLTYYGVDLTALQETLAGRIAVAEAITDKMDATVAGALADAITTAKAAPLTEDGLNSALTTINTAITNAQNSVAFYATVAAVNAQAATFDEAGQAAYAPTLEKYNNGTIVSLAEAEAALQIAARAQGVGADYTAVLANPDFKTNDLTGWNTNGKAIPAVDVANHDCEFYEKTFDMSQTVTNLKKGTYEISFQAFQRPGAANNDLATNYVNNNWTSCATLYTSAQTSNVKHICEDWSETEVFNNGSWQSDSQVTPADGTLHYIPNSMAGGRLWFDKGYYVTTAKAVVTEEGGSLTFGFRGQQPGSSWILFDNFKMKYISTDVLVDEAESEKVIASATALEGKKMTEALKPALAEAKAALVAAKTSGEKYNALKDAVAASEASVNAYEALKAALDAPAFVDRKDVFYLEFTYRAEAQKMYDAATADTKDVQAKAGGMLNAYRDYVKAIAANEKVAKAVEGVKDVRENTAWEYTTNPQNNAVFNNPGNMDITGNTMWENWRGTGLAEGEMKQLVSVPNGKYFLRMVSFTRNSVNENDYIYIKSGDEEAKALSLGDAGNSNGFVNITDPIEVKNGEVEIGLHVGSGADWAAIGGVVLYAYHKHNFAPETAKPEYDADCHWTAVTCECGDTAHINVEEHVYDQPCPTGFACVCGKLEFKYQVVEHKVALNEETNDLAIEFVTLDEHGEYVFPENPVFASAFLSEMGATTVPVVNGYYTEKDEKVAGAVLSSDIPQMNSFNLSLENDALEAEKEYSVVLPEGFFVFFDTTDYDFKGVEGDTNLGGAADVRARAKAASMFEGELVSIPEIKVSFVAKRGTVTAIKSIEMLAGDGKAYNLAGQITNNGRGIKIVNGKKFMVK